ncbi:hypothetical protein HPP92_022947 [Vanilla planifolia]|uniref:Uncharacterized protein n=1 Tax=Vanilla planifolia TaxID=51239 RepID=A0A835UEA8_VANPL|nr:hypothetical protein HPP92_022947 [Vanilla planifolia]
MSSMSRMGALQSGQLPRPVHSSRVHALQNVCPHGMNAAPFRLTMHTQHTIRSALTAIVTAFSSSSSCSSSAIANTVTPPPPASSAPSPSVRARSVIRDALTGGPSPASSGIRPPPVDSVRCASSSSLRMSSSVRPPRFSDSSIDARVTTPAVRLPDAEAEEA